MMLNTLFTYTMISMLYVNYVSFICILKLNNIILWFNFGRGFFVPCSHFGRTFFNLPLFLDGQIKNQNEKICFFRAKGAAIVNCDTIAHDLYKPDLPLNRTISEVFGQDVITENGEVDRRRLGQIVFADHVIKPFSFNFRLFGNQNRHYSIFEIKNIRNSY